MAISEAVRRAVDERDNGECQLFHRRPIPATEVAYIRHQGMGGDVPGAEVNQPDNLLSTCAECHRKLHGPGMPHQIVQFVPDEGVLEGVDGEGRRVLHEQLWWYAKEDMKSVMWAMQRIQHRAQQIRDAQWEIGSLIASLYAKADLLAELGTDVYGVGMEAGLPSADVKRLARVHRWAEDMQLDCRALDPAIVDRLRKVPEDEIEEVFAEAQALSRQDLLRLLNDRYGSERMRTFRIFQAPEYREVRARTEDEVEYAPGEVVVRGGSVISGVTREVEANHA